jgi:hypothetical protein
MGEYYTHDFRQKLCIIGKYEVVLYLLTWDPPLVVFLSLIHRHFLPTTSPCPPRVLPLSSSQCTAAVGLIIYRCRSPRLPHRARLLQFPIGDPPRARSSRGGRRAEGSGQRTQLQCLTEAKAHGALPPHPPSNLDRMDKNARNLNTKFKLAGKFWKNYSTSFSFKYLIWESFNPFGHTVCE